MTGLFIFIHAVICIFLIIFILMQSGKGGGLTESFASAESIFGAKTNVFMIKTTTVLATGFLLTCLGLAILSSQKSRSLMSERALPPASTQQPLQDIPAPPSADEPIVQPEPVPQAPAPAPEAAVPATQPNQGP